jgi:hypothetical protein
MSFSKTSRNIRLSEGRLLSADCLRNNGTYKRTTINLQDWLGIVDGGFAFAGKLRFWSHSKYERLDGTILQADLPGSDGVFRQHRLDLDEIIANENGSLVPYVRNAFGACL